MDRQTVYHLVVVAVTVSILADWFLGRVGVLSDPKATRKWLLGFGVLADRIHRYPGRRRADTGPSLGHRQWLSLRSRLRDIVQYGGGNPRHLDLAYTCTPLRAAVRRVSPESQGRRPFDRLAADQGLLAIFVVFLILGSPDDVICFVGGVTEIDVRKLLVVSFVGRLPVTVTATMAGASIQATRYVEAAIVFGVLLLDTACYGETGSSPGSNRHNPE